MLFQRFILPISHDEVAHGKGSLISKMPGDYDSKFAGVRTFITYMYAHPGKKLVFMGCEIGQFDEWDSDSGIQWDLLKFEKHNALYTFFKAINKFYIEHKPLYELDNTRKALNGYTVTTTLKALLLSEEPTRTATKSLQSAIFSRPFTKTI